jgi:hypothetical protein
LYYILLKFIIGEEDTGGEAGQTQGFEGVKLYKENGVSIPYAQFRSRNSNKITMEESSPPS